MTDAAGAQGPDADSAAERERHATNLELFLDLVFVFAITQIASLIASNPTVAGLGRGLLITWLVWWQWSQFTWAGSAIDLQAVRATRVLVLCIIPVALLNAVAIPTVFGDGGWVFGLTNLGIVLIVLAIQGTVARSHPDTWSAFVRYAMFAVVAPAIVLIGGLLPGTARVVLWLVALALHLVGAVSAGTAGEWRIDPVHFAERHALFVIIALGEVLVASGATATEVGLSWSTVAGLFAAVAVACAMWWTYFAFIPQVTEHRLREMSGADRGRFARDVFSFGHFPLVVGVVAYAVVAKHVVQHPLDALGAHDRWMLTLSAVAYVGGLLAMQWRSVHGLAIERLVAIGVVGAACVAGRWMAGAVLVAAVAVVLLTMQAITVRRINRAAARPVAPNA
ncbi:MAG: low temperature requirement protein A [Ilumatobacteraceae bacterium]